MALAVQVQDRVDIQAILQTAVAVPASLRKAAYFIDVPEIPLDRRYVEVTKSDYESTLDSSGYPYAFAGLHFSQALVPQSLQIARWAQSASNPYWIAGDHETTLATWTAITDGSFEVAVNGTPTTNDEVTGVDFSSATALSQIPAILTAATNSAASNVTGLDTAVWSFDVYGRLILTMPGTGASAVAVTITAAASGTDISATLLDAPNGTVVLGVDAESIADAIDALRATDDTAYFYTAKFTTSTDEARATEILAMAAKVESLSKVCIVTADDTDIKNSSVDTDIFSQLDQLAYKRTLGIYFENISDRPKIIPEAAVLGRVISADEGSISFAQNDLTGLTPSGYSTPLTKSLTDVVKAKGGNVIETVAGFTYLYSGLVFGGEELRIIVGRDWFVNTIAAALFSYQIQQPLTAFDNETITAAANIVLETGQEAIDRRILVDTVERPFTVTPPDADDFTQAERASHIMAMSNFFQAYLNSSVTDWQIIGTWTI
jgi:hypothetical protein